MMNALQPHPFRRSSDSCYCSAILQPHPWIVASAGMGTRPACPTWIGERRRDGAPMLYALTGRGGILAPQLDEWMVAVRYIHSRTMYQADAYPPSAKRCPSRGARCRVSQWVVSNARPYRKRKFVDDTSLIQGGRAGTLAYRVELVEKVELVGAVVDEHSSSIRTGPRAERRMPPRSMHQVDAGRCRGFRWRVANGVRSHEFCDWPHPFLDWSRCSVVFY